MWIWMAIWTWELLVLVLPLLRPGAGGIQEQPQVATPALALSSVLRHRLLLPLLLLLPRLMVVVQSRWVVTAGVRPVSLVPALTLGLSSAMRPCQSKKRRDGV